MAGFDWGVRTANVMAALWPERCRAMVSVSGYLIGSQAAGQAPLLPEAERAWWYQYYFATERGEQNCQARVRLKGTAMANSARVFCEVIRRPEHDLLPGPWCPVKGSP